MTEAMVKSDVGDKLLPEGFNDRLSAEIKNALGDIEDWWGDYGCNEVVEDYAYEAVIKALDNKYDIVPRPDGKPRERKEMQNETIR